MLLPYIQEPLLYALQFIVKHKVEKYYIAVVKEGPDNVSMMFGNYNFLKKKS